MSVFEVAAREAYSSDVPTRAYVDTVYRRAFVDVFVSEDLAVVFALAEFPAAVLLGILDRLSLLFSPFVVI